MYCAKKVFFKTVLKKSSALLCLEFFKIANDLVKDFLFKFESSGGYRSQIVIYTNLPFFI